MMPQLLANMILPFLLAVAQNSQSFLGGCYLQRLLMSVLEALRPLNAGLDSCLLSSCTCGLLPWLHSVIFIQLGCAAVVDRAGMLRHSAAPGALHPAPRTWCQPMYIWRSCDVSSLLKRMLAVGRSCAFSHCMLSRFVCHWSPTSISGAGCRNTKSLYGHLLCQTDTHAAQAASQVLAKNTSRLLLIGGGTQL